MALVDFFVKPVGFVLVNVQVPCVKGYNEDQIMIVLDNPNMNDCPVILGTPTLFCVMQVIKEGEITKLATPWATSHLSWLFGNLSACMAQLPLTNVANKAITPTSVSEVVRTSNKVQLPLFGHKIIHGKTGLTLQGFKMNVMTHGLEQRSPQLPLGIDILSCYVTLTTGSNCVAVALRNNTNDWIEIEKGTPITWMEAANQVPPVDGSVVAAKAQAPEAMSEAQRREMVLQKLDLSGLDS